jgi:hypothetical protein
MTNKLTWLSLGTLGVAFAIMLSPSILQTDELSCGGAVGECRLCVLEVAVNGENKIEFDPMVYTYEVTLPEGVETVTVTAQSMDPAAQVMYNHSGACPPPIAHGMKAEGQTEFVLEELPAGHSLLKVSVDSPEGKSASYGIFFTNPVECS